MRAEGAARSKVGCVGVITGSAGAAAIGAGAGAGVTATTVTGCSAMGAAATGVIGAGVCVTRSSRFEAQPTVTKVTATTAAESERSLVAFMVRFLGAGAAQVSAAEMTWTTAVA